MPHESWWSLSVILLILSIYVRFSFLNLRCRPRATYPQSIPKPIAKKTARISPTFITNYPPITSDFDPPNKSPKIALYMEGRVPGLAVSYFLLFTFCFLDPPPAPPDPWGAEAPADAALCQVDTTTAPASSPAICPEAR
jgi:hypothetical protein